MPRAPLSECQELPVTSPIASGRTSGCVKAKRSFGRWQKVFRSCAGWHAATDTSSGTTPEQMEGWGWQSVHDPQTLPKVLEQWRASISTGVPFDMVFPLRGADGVFRPFLTRVMPIEDADGRVVRWLGTNTDITELRDAQEA